MQSGSPSSRAVAAGCAPEASQSPTEPGPCWAPAAAAAVADKICSQVNDSQLPAEYEGRGRLVCDSSGWAPWTHIIKHAGLGWAQQGRCLSRTSPVSSSQSMPSGSGSPPSLAPGTFSCRQAGQADRRRVSHQCRDNTQRQAPACHAWPGSSASQQAHNSGLPNSAWPLLPAATCLHFWD
jgi:hypothetical protein